MLFERIDVCLPEGVVPGQYVAIEGNRVAYIGGKAPSVGEYAGETYDGKGKLLMPAFFNAHAHTPMTLMRGYGENLTLHDWLKLRIFPFEARMTGRDIYYSTLLGIAEMLRFGIVSATDMYSNLDDMARAFIESGAKVNLCNAVTNFTGQPYETLAATKDAHAAAEKHHMAADGRVRVDFGVHAEYTSDEKTVRAAAEDVAKRGLRAHVHISETKMEHEECKARRGGKTPVAYFASCGLLDVPATAAHCVWIDDEDRAILAEKGATVASCPKSNLKLGSGVFDARAARKAGVPFAIATDSVASNNNLNMMEELRVFLLAQKGFSGDPTLITPKEALYAATRAGALSQGREDCGEIREGNRADLIVLDVSGPSMWPAHEMLNNVAYSASGSDVLLTMCDGKILYRDGVYKTIDLERVFHEVEASRARILSELSLPEPINKEDLP